MSPADISVEADSMLASHVKLAFGCEIVRVPEMLVIFRGENVDANLM